jgi:hypothetical protein
VPQLRGVASLSALHHALVDRDVERVLAVAQGRRVVPLKYAARIVCLLADRADPRYDRAASRFLIRVAEEYEPPLEQLWRLANCLRFVHDTAYQYEAREGLQHVVVQLARREPLRLHFKGDI